MARLGTATDPLPLRGTPEGLAAYPVYAWRDTDAGPVPITDRAGRARVRAVVLRGHGVQGATRHDAANLLEALRPGQRSFVLGATRRSWTAIVSAFHDTADTTATELAKVGIVELQAELHQQRLALGRITGWTLTEAWRARRVEQQARRADQAAAWTSRAQRLASTVAARHPSLARALRQPRPIGATLEVLVYAAEDLDGGVRYAGPRAFSQAHFHDTKQRDDVDRLLARAGVAEDVRAELGVRSGGELGVSGEVYACTTSGQADLSGFVGPVVFQVDQPDLSFRPARNVPLVIVENKQAAKAFGRRRDLLLVYTAGCMSQDALRLLAGLAHDLSRVLVVPDADLGGVRIATQVAQVAHGAEIIDIGTFPAPTRRPWSPASTSVRGLNDALDGPAGALARACLERGYPVEQELATVEAVDGALRTG